VKVSGVVTLASPAGWLCVQDETGSLTAWLFQPIGRDEDPHGKFLKRDHPALVPGDCVELVGALREGSAFAPGLTDAEYRRIGHREPPQPRDVSSGYLLTGKHDAELVRLKARVVDIESQNNVGLFEEKIWLQSDGATFEARLDASAPIHLTVETCGEFAGPVFVDRLLPLVDLIYFDLKFADPALHLAKWMMLSESERPAAWTDFEQRVLPQTSEAITNPRSVTSWMIEYRYGFSLR